MHSIDTPLNPNPSFNSRMRIELDNGISFHAYHDDTRWTVFPGYIIATTRAVEDPTNEYDTLEDVPDSILDNIDYEPEYYSLRIGTTPVIVDYSGTLLIPQCYNNSSVTNS